MADEWLSMMQARNVSGLSRATLIRLGHEGKVEMMKGSGKGWHKFQRHSLLKYLNEAQSDTRLDVTDVVSKLREIVTQARHSFEVEGLHSEYQALTSLLAILAEK